MATIKVPAIVEQLEQGGAHVIVVPTRSALHFLRAAADAVAREPPVTVAAASAGVTEVDCAHLDLPTGRKNERGADRIVFEKSEKHEETGINERWDTGSGNPCGSATKYSNEGNSFGLGKLLRVNKIKEGKDRKRELKKYCVSKITYNGENGSARSLCCTIVNDCQPTSGTDSQIAKDSSDCVQGPNNCEVGLGKLLSSKTVHTQTDVAGVDCGLTWDSSDAVRNVTNTNTLKPNITNEKDKSVFPTLSSSNIERANSVPSKCLSCLKLLEVAALGSFKSETGNILHVRASCSSKPLPKAGLLVETEEGSSQSRSGDDGDLPSVLDSPSPSCAWCATQRLLPELVIAGDALEWEGWRGRGDPVLHIELRRWADLGVIAPLSANTLAKLANGLCDNLLTCVTRAWDTKKPLLFCPAMNTHMYNHPLTGRQITTLSELGYMEVPAVSKRLMCGDVGGGAMAEVGTIVEAVWSALQQQELLSIAI